MATRNERCARDELQKAERSKLQYSKTLYVAVSSFLRWLAPENCASACRALQLCGKNGQVCRRCIAADMQNGPFNPFSSGTNFDENFQKYITYIPGEKGLTPTWVTLSSVVPQLSGSVLVLPKANKHFARLATTYRDGKQKP